MTFVSPRVIGNRASGSPTVSVDLYWGRGRTSTAYQSRRSRRTLSKSVLYKRRWCSGYFPTVIHAKSRTYPLLYYCCISRFSNGCIKRSFHTPQSKASVTITSRNSHMSFSFEDPPTGISYVSRNI